MITRISLAPNTGIPTLAQVLRSVRPPTKLYVEIKGRGIEFSEVRPYQVGDDIRSIDWNVSARTGEPYVKVFEEEREQTLMLVVDVSGSEEFGSSTQFKREIAAEIMRQGIVEDITKIVDAQVKSENYDLVFDNSGMSLNGVPVVMFAKPTYDFTDVVVTALNKNKGSEGPDSGAKAATKTGDKAETPKKKAKTNMSPKMKTQMPPSPGRWR